jgi:hypothetical protein
VGVVVVGVVVAIVTCWVCLQRPAATQQLLALALALAPAPVPVRNNNHQWLIYKLSSKRYKWKIKNYKQQNKVL